MVKLSEKVINQNLVPQLSKGKRGSDCKVGLWRIVRAILYRLKTVIQWRELPIRSLFGHHSISWNSVFYYFELSEFEGRLHISVTLHHSPSFFGSANSPPDINNGSYFSTEKSVPPEGLPQFYLLINLLFRCLLLEGVNFY